jgi:hypothetical protein
VINKTKIQPTGTGNKKKCPIEKFSLIGGEQYPTNQIVAKKLNERWCSLYYHSEIRVFLFKLYHNTLGLNYRVHHINPERPETCTFCVKSKNLPPERETFMHFFWYCPSVQKVLDTFFQRNIGFNVAKSNYLFSTDDKNNFNESLSVVFDLVKFILWQNKLQKTLPNITGLENELNYHLSFILGSSTKLRNKFNGCDLFRRNGE